MMGTPVMHVPYSQTLCRRTPGLFVILLDQSESMLQKDERTGLTKAETATSYVNFILEKMIRLAQCEELSGERKNYAYVSVLGYNHATYPLLGENGPTTLSELDNRSLGDAKIMHMVPDASKQVYKRVIEKTRVWLKPHGSGKTDMTQAFEETEQIIHSWLAAQPVPYEKRLDGQVEIQDPRSESFPPILIHITDAKDGGRQDPHTVSERIRKMHTNYGNVLIFNCHFTHEQAAITCSFPATLQELLSYTTKKYAENMFYMSSELPEILRERAREYMQRPIPAGARCFIYNANPEILLNFLHWTTVGTTERGVR